MKNTARLAFCLFLALSLTTSVFAGAGTPPESYMDMAPQQGLESRTAELHQTWAAMASLTFFNDRATFEAAAPGLTLEDFENGNVGPGGVIPCGNPLENGDPCFAPGGLADGFSLSASVGQTVALGDGVIGQPSIAVGPDLFNANASFAFTAPDVFAVGFDLFDPFGSAFTVTLVGEDSTVLGSMVVQAPAFFGVKSDQIIARVDIAATGFGAEIFDNLLFGRGVIDTDGDGIPDDDDACVESDLSATVVIDGCDSGVDNVLFDNGCTISDLAAACADGAGNHGQYVSCIAHLTNELKKDGVISGRDKGRIQSCAAKADLP